MCGNLFIVNWGEVKSWSLLSRTKNKSDMAALGVPIDGIAFLCCKGLASSDDRASSDFA